MPHIETLKKLDACIVAVEFAATHDSAQCAWNACERGDWLLWLIGKVAAGEPWSDQRRKMALAAADCAALALPIDNPKLEFARMNAINTARRWGNGANNRKEMERAITASAAAAAYAAYTADAADAAAGAAYTADAADAAAYAAAAAAAGADAAAYAAAAAAAGAAGAADARNDVLHKCAEIVRSYYPDSPI